MPSNIAKKCPFCGSTSIEQTNETSNKVIGFAVAKGIGLLLGGIHTSASGVTSILGTTYECKMCHRTWEGDGHNPEGIPEEDLAFNKVMTSIINESQKFISESDLRMYLWKIDAYIYDIDSKSELTGYGYGDDAEINPFSLDDEMKSRFHFLKSLGCLLYVCNILDNKAGEPQVKYYDLKNACDTGIAECEYAMSLKKTEEFVFCIYIFNKIKHKFLREAVKVDECLTLSPHEELICGYEWWCDVNKEIERLPLFPVRSCSSTEIINYYLNNDFRLSLWYLNSYYVGSIFHIINKKYCSYITEDYIKETNSEFRENFEIPKKEEIIFHRDNTFFSSDHNQGVVITNKAVYYIEDNDIPFVQTIRWENLVGVKYNNGNREFVFSTTEEDIAIDVNYFTYKCETFPNSLIHRMGEQIAASFSCIINLIKQNKESPIENSSVPLEQTIKYIGPSSPNELNGLVNKKEEIMIENKTQNNMNEEDRYFDIIHNHKLGFDKFAEKEGLPLLSEHNYEIVPTKGLLDIILSGYNKILDFENPQVICQEPKLEHSSRHEYVSNTGHTDDIECVESEYLDVIKECLRNGEIGVGERRLLEKIRMKLGISEIRAKELEESLSHPSVSSSNEEEYIEELKECLSSGSISDGERRLLDKIRIKLGISEERAKELEESLSAPKLTDDEQEYLNEYKECIASGSISESERRLLEKVRKMSGISEERARELEKMA